MSLGRHRGIFGAYTNDKGRGHGRHATRQSSSIGEEVISLDMSIPDYQTVMLPLLRFLRDGKERSLGEAVDAVAEHFKLSLEERQQLLPSGASTVIGNRVGWARTYLKQAT